MAQDYFLVNFKTIPGEKIGSSFPKIYIKLKLAAKTIFLGLKSRFARCRKSEYKTKGRPPRLLLPEKINVPGLRSRPPDQNIHRQKAAAFLNREPVLLCLWIWPVQYWHGKYLLHKHHYFSEKIVFTSRCRSPHPEFLNQCP